MIILSLNNLSLIKGCISSNGGEIKFPFWSLYEITLGSKNCFLSTIISQIQAFLKDNTLFIIFLFWSRVLIEKYLKPKAIDNFLKFGNPNPLLLPQPISLFSK